MSKPLIMVSSITYAMKAKSLLSSYGIKSDVRRTPKHTTEHGCSYSVYVPQNTDEAEKLLLENHIKVIGRTEWRE